MKYLIAEDFRAIRKGEFVKPTGIAEFVFDTADCSSQTLKEKTELTLAQLKDIAEANGIKIPATAKTKKLFLESLENEMSEQSIPEQNEKTTSDKVAEIVKAGYESGADEELMLVQIVQAGVKFKNARRELEQAAESLGLKIDRKKVKARIEEVLDGQDEPFAPKEWAHIEATVKVFTSEDEFGDKVEEKMIISLLRQYCKLNEIEFPKKSKVKAAGGAGGGSFRQRMLSWLLQNKDATLEQFTAVVKAERGDAADPKRVANTAARLYYNLEFARALEAGQTEAPNQVHAIEELESTDAQDKSVEEQTEEAA